MKQKLASSKFETICADNLTHKGAVNLVFVLMIDSITGLILMICQLLLGFFMELFFYNVATYQTSKEIPERPVLST
jgi:hypothetical protein